MSNMERPSTRLRGLLDAPGALVCPAAYDCLSLKLIEAAGFKLAGHGNFNTAASMLGLPDYGLIDMTETLAAVRRMAACVSIPLLADVDDGFGEPVNVARTTREVIRAGAGGMYMEDQVSPKRCPALGGSEVISTEAMLRKLRAAFDVRREDDPDFVIMARTHASRAISFEEGLARGVAYAEAGADIIFVDLGYSEEVYRELERIAEEIGPRAHVLANMTEGVGRPLIATGDLEAMGFKLILYPGTAIASAAGAVRAALQELMEKGTTAGAARSMMNFREIGELLGKEAWDQLDQRLR